MKKRSFLTIPLAAFLLSVGAFIIFLYLYDVLGYGNLTILRGDLYGQYIDFIHMFLRVLKGEEDFWYTFSEYMGSASILTYTYYAFSPFNLLYLFDKISIPAMTAVIISLKIGLCGTTFSVFAHKVLKCSAPASVFFALCYAFNSFNITLHFNLIWLEAAYMLPLIIMLIYDLVKKEHCPALVLAWSFLFLSNFYMAYITGLFSACVFICMLLINYIQERPKISRLIVVCLRFIFYVFISAGCCAVILLPCALFLKSHMAADNISFSELSTSFFEVMNSMSMGSVTDMDNRSPFIYCGLPVLLLLPFYFTNRLIPRYERIISGILLIIQAVSILYLPAFILSHAFDYPNYYFFRNSCCICFLLCALSARTFKVTNATLPAKKLWLWILSIISFLSFMKVFGPLNSSSWERPLTSKDLAINCLFLFTWGILFSPRKAVNNKILRMLLPVMCFVFLIAELTINGRLSMDKLGLPPISEEAYNSWYNAQSNVLAQIPDNDTDFYRIALYGDNNYNSAALFGYAGFNTFSSSDEYDLRQALYNLGISVSNRSIAENGYTDLTYMLLGTGYTGSIIKPDNTQETRYSQLDRFSYRLPVAYMVSDAVDSFSFGKDPFMNQENLVNAFTGRNYHFFDRVDISSLNKGSFNADMIYIDDMCFFSKRSDYSKTASMYFTTEKKEDRILYACFKQTTPSSSLYVPVLLGDNCGFAISVPLSQSCIMRFGNANGSFDDKTDALAIYFPEDSEREYYCKEILFYQYDDSDIAKLHKDLLNGAMALKSHSSSYFHGTVTATPERPVLFTSITWDPGWTATVDGKAYACEKVLDGAFLSLHLSPGEHEITLKYVAPGSRTGMIISLISLGSFVVYLVLLTLAKKKKQITQ